MNPENSPISDALLYSQKTRFSDGNKNIIGLAWGVLEKDGKRGLGHSGGTGGFNSNLQISLTDNKGFLTLVNASTSIQYLGAILITKEKCEPDFGRKVPDTLLNKYVGKYENEQTKLVFILTKKFGKLFYELPGQESGKMDAVDNKKFSIKGIATLEFLDELNQDG